MEYYLRYMLVLNARMLVSSGFDPFSFSFLTFCDPPYPPVTWIIGPKLVWLSALALGAKIYVFYELTMVPVDNQILSACIILGFVVKQNICDVLSPDDYCFLLSKEKLLHGFRTILN